MVNNSVRENELPRILAGINSLDISEGENTATPRDKFYVGENLLPVRDKRLDHTATAAI